jgi:hypothetical protein
MNFSILIESFLIWAFFIGVIVFVVMRLSGFNKLPIDERIKRRKKLLLALVIASVFSLLIGVAYLWLREAYPSQSLSHSRSIIPVWLVSLIVAFIGYKHIKDAKKYRDHKLFIKEVGGRWLDESRAEEASKLYIYLNAIFAVFVPLLFLLFYVPILSSYLMQIFLVFLILWLCAAVSGYFAFSKQT